MQAPHTERNNVTERTFHAWPKISRFAAETMVLTEKIDGSNAAVVITEDDIYAQSRSRVITPDKDNFGFARWVEDNKDSLIQDLGQGVWHGEWWGAGIQRRYGLEYKRFSLFNTYRFAEAAPYFKTPSMNTVPLLYVGPFDTDVVGIISSELYRGGSMAAPGFDRPEGVVVYLRNANTQYKITDAVQGEKHRG